MPLFLTADVYVPVPLEATYLAAWSAALASADRRLDGLTRRCSHDAAPCSPVEGCHWIRYPSPRILRVICTISCAWPRKCGTL
jgi:hypothetical protein